MKGKNNNSFQKPITGLYIILQVFVIVLLIMQIIDKHWHNATLCIASIILFFVPIIINKKTNITIPQLFEALILLFIFSTQILGEILNFYGLIPCWDILLHILNGFLCGAIGFSLINILNGSNTFYTHLSHSFIIITSICFSICIATIWELYEFQSDTFIKTDMQKDYMINSITSIRLNSKMANTPVKIDNIIKTIVYCIDENETKTIEINNGYLDIGLTDTIKDLFVSFIGVLGFCIIELLYLNSKNKYMFINNLLPKLKEKDNN